MILPTITERQHATILAALRWYQATGLNPTVYDDLTADVHDIATNGQRLKAMNEEEIDVLCERINVGGSGHAKR